ncbi:hypothetical protein IMSAGC007_03808 [Lachnospiraceae bacterium]|nr:hypothetical protein IMSAGC007_03808 [Lachnospiraceae bacterium]
MPGHNTHAGVYRRLCLHSRSHNRCFRHQQRHCLTLHVGAHQRTVCVVIFQERNERRRHREHHLRRYVHVIKHGTLILLRLLAVTSGYVPADKMSLCIQGLICLGHMVIILFIRRHVYHLVGNTGILRIGFVNLTVRRLHKAVLVDSCIGCKRVDKTDVGAFRGLNGAHSSVVGIVHVTNLESGTVSGQAAGSKCRQTALVGQLSQGVILIHELGQLGGSEELFHGRSYRLNVDEGLGRNVLLILRRHTLPDGTLHSGQTDAVLVLQKLAHRTDTAVAQMVNVVVIAHTVFQMQVIVNGSNNIFLCNMLWNQLVNITLHGCLALLQIARFIQYLFQSRVIY